VKAHRGGNVDQAGEAECRVDDQPKRAVERRARLQLKSRVDQVADVSQIAEEITRADDQRAVLTDFELAKLVDTGPTVSTSWPDDPYRAPEVEDATASERSDLYSWARVLLRVATGEELPEKGQDGDTLTRVGLPKAVWRVALDCLSPGPSDRAWPSRAWRRL